MPFRHELRVRYAEVDVQGHAFNAHYLTYVDEAMDAWMRATIGEDYYSGGAVDMVLKRADLTWHAGARFGEILAIDVEATRWGTTSFDITYRGAVGERPVFEAVVTYISIEPGTLTPTPVPTHVRTTLG